MRCADRVRGRRRTLETGCAGLRAGGVLCEYVTISSQSVGVGA